MRVVYWGTYDSGKPRNRILIRGLKENGIEVIECNKNPWAGVEDKSQLVGFKTKLLFFCKWVLCYPPLIYQYFKLPKHDIVVVGYLGHLDVLVIWLLAKIRRVPVVWDAFLSIYDTVVHDRKMTSSASLSAYCLYSLEWLSCRAANLVVLDTTAHAEYFIETFHLSTHKCCSVFVGAEPEIFPVVPKKIQTPDNKTILTILFYGQFIPLHGIKTLVEAACILREQNVHWTIIGQGQEEQNIDDLIRSKSLSNLIRIKWVDYNKLKDHINEADICLGIFGTSDKASRVIPNKVFQIVSSGKLLITRDSPAIKELLTDQSDGVIFVKPGSPESLATAIAEIVTDSKRSVHEPYFHDERQRITPRAIGNSLLENMRNHMNLESR